MFIATRKFPICTSFDDHQIVGDEFIIPKIMEYRNSDDFIGIKTGKLYVYGALTYIGISINSFDVYEKAENIYSDSRQREGLLKLLDEYLLKIKEFKVGNVIKIRYHNGGHYDLIKVANKPTITTKRNLP